MRVCILWFTFFLLLSVMGCTEAQPVVNRVQANAIRKSIFIGSEWYANKTVIDTPYTSSATFVGDSGLSSSMDRITWEIQEDYLIAHSSYQHIQGSEASGVAGSGINRNPIVAMYAIESHFDIRHEYNSITGEKLNIINENSSDRVWYEREYMRVDWSKNLIGDQFFTLSSALTGVELEPINYYIQDPDHPFAPKFETDPNGEVYYIDIVNKYFAKPDSVVMEDGRTIPTCFLLFRMPVDCQPAEIAVRSSFLRIDPRSDYQPMMYTADRMERFGYFLTIRDSYSNDYETTELGRAHFINRHNIWQKSHKQDDNGEWISCTKDDECGGNGSVCDLAIGIASGKGNGACTIPFRDRTVSPITYYLSKDFPEDLIPDAEAMASQWNQAFVDTVRSLVSLDCEENSSLEECENDSSKYAGEDIFVLCNNPVTADDPEVCGAVGTVAEVGDIRYNQVAWVPEPHISSPLGYGPSFTDPLTGEIIQATAFIYGARVETISAQTRDILALLNHDIGAEQFTDKYKYAQMLADGIRPQLSSDASNSEADRHVVKLDGRDAAHINQSMDFTWMREVLGIQDKPPIIPTAKTLLEDWQRAKSNLVSAVSELHVGDLGHARLNRLKGTDIEEMMITDELRLLSGYQPGTEVTESLIESASPLRGMNPNHKRAVDKLHRKMTKNGNLCLLHEDFVEDGLLGLVREINRSIQRGDGTIDWYGVEYKVVNGRGVIDYSLVKEMLRHPIFNSVVTHEVGHTLGLRHNFASSYDSLNYHPRYWELRNDGNMQPRAWDPLTQQEIDGRIQEYQYASVMDYGQNSVVADAAGIGHYDKAAIKMGYGDLVEVFTEVPARNQVTAALLSTIQSFGFPGALEIRQGGEIAIPLRMIPYTEIPEIFGGIEHLEDRADVRYTDLIDGTARLDSEQLGVLTADPKGRPTVPYRYCGDEFTDREPSCFRWDSGADTYETIMSVIDAYWNYYIFNNFMRQRLGFNPSMVENRIFERYFEKLQNSNLYYTYFRGLLDQFGADQEFFQRVDGFGAYTTGIGAAYKLFTKVIATPEPSPEYGCHGLYQTIDGQEVLAPESHPAICGQLDSVVIDSFNGRSLYTDYDLGPDQSFWHITRSGFFYDKLLALQMLSDPLLDIQGEDRDPDIRRFQVSFYTSFPRALTSVFRAIIGQDWQTFAPRLVNDGLLFPDPQDHIDRNLDGTMVDPNLSFSLQLYAMVYSMALTPSGFDQTLVDKSRLFVRGGAESVDLELPEDAQFIEFVDEDSGLVYIAPSYPDEEGRETGVAAQMLLHAQQLQQEGAVSALNMWMDNLNVMRRLTWLLGFGGNLTLQ